MFALPVLLVGLAAAGGGRGQGARPPCSRAESVVLEGAVAGEGAFLAADGTVYPAGTFYLEPGADAYRGCPCLARACVRKCCPQGTFIGGLEADETTFVCNQSDELPPFDLVRLARRHFAGRANPVENLTGGHFRVEAGVRCRETWSPLDDYLFLPSGGVLERRPVYNETVELLIDYREYCVDVVAWDEETPPALTVLICLAGREIGARSYVYCAFRLLASACLLLTLLVYGLLPRLRNVPGRCLLGYAASALAANLSATVFELDVFADSFRAQFVVACIIYYSLMSSYFWLNVMCYDIWSVFRRNVQPKKARSLKEAERKKFLNYSIYAWGCSTALFLITLGMDTLSFVPSNWIKPQFAIATCWIGSKAGTYLYFYGPMLVLLCANMYFFGVTIWQIRQISKQTEVLKTKESRRHHEKEKQRCYLYGKLFVVMGVSWITEIISYAMGGSEYFWYLSDIFNICQGVSIFVIFVLKRRILAMLNVKLCPSVVLLAPTESFVSKPTRSTISSSNATNGGAAVPSMRPDGEQPDPAAIRMKHTSISVSEEA